MTWFFTFLDTRLFPAIVKYATARLHIVALLILGIVLMVWHDALLELVGGNYTNIISAMVSCIVLLQQVSHHQEVKQLLAKKDRQDTQDHAQDHEQDHADA